MKIRMKVDRLFKIGKKTIFAGSLDAQPGVIRDALCAVEIDGKITKKVRIDGEVSSGTDHRDLWTNSLLELSDEMLASHEVWLVEL